MKAKGVQAIAGMIKMWWTGFPDAKADAQLTLVNKNKYAAIVLMTQTNTGKKGMMPPTGKKVVAFEAQAGTLNADDKVKKHWIFENTMQYPIQLGLIDPNKMAGHKAPKK